MLSISSAQLEAIGDRRFSAKLANLIHSAYPDADSIKSPTDHQKILAEFRKARSYGFCTELEIGRFVITAWLLGIDFDRRYGAFSEILNAEQLSPAAKSEALEKVSIAVLAQLELQKARHA